MTLFDEERVATDFGELRVVPARDGFFGGAGPAGRLADVYAS